MTGAFYAFLLCVLSILEIQHILMLNLMTGGAVQPCRCTLSGREEEQALGRSFQGEYWIYLELKNPSQGPKMTVYYSIYVISVARSTIPWR